LRYLTLTYYKQPNGKVNESMTVTKHLRHNDWAMSSVILDFKTQEVLKCSMGGTTVPKNWDRIVSYYYQHYAATIERLFQENGHKVNADQSKEPIPIQ